MHKNFLSLLYTTQTLNESWEDIYFYLNSVAMSMTEYLLPFLLKISSKMCLFSTLNRSKCTYFCLFWCTYNKDNSRNTTALIQPISVHLWVHPLYFLDLSEFALKRSAEWATQRKRRRGERESDRAAHLSCWTDRKEDWPEMENEGYFWQMHGGHLGAVYAFFEAQS